jgi:hypothetical protein
MGKDANFFLSAGLVIGLTASFSLIGVMIRRLPQRWINLPNRAYWLAPEREVETRSHLAGWCWAFGTVLNLFLAFIFHMVFLANTSDPVAMNNPVMRSGLAVYLTVALGSVVALLLHFGRGR